MPTILVDEERHLFSASPSEASDHTIIHNEAEADVERSETWCASLNRDEFKKVAKRNGIALAGGFGAATVGSLPLGYASGWIGNIVLNGARAFTFSEEIVILPNGYTAIGKQTNSTLLQATALASFLAFPVIAVLEENFELKNKPWGEPLTASVACSYLCGSGGALIGALGGFLLSIPIQTALGIDSQSVGDGFRIVGAAAGAGAALFGMYVANKPRGFKVPAQHQLVLLTEAVPHRVS